MSKSQMNPQVRIARIGVALLFVLVLVGSCSMHPISAKYDECLSGCMDRCPEGEYDPGGYATTADNRSNCEWNCQQLCRNRDSGKTPEPPKTPIFP